MPLIANLPAQCHSQIAMQVSRWSSLLTNSVTPSIKVCGYLLGDKNPGAFSIWFSVTECFLSMKLSEYDGSRWSKCQPMQAFVQSFILLEIIHHWLSVLSIIPESGPADFPHRGLWLVSWACIMASDWSKAWQDWTQPEPTTTSFYSPSLWIPPSEDHQYSSVKSNKNYFVRSSKYSPLTGDPLNVIISYTSAHSGWQTEILFITRSSAVSRRQWYKNLWYLYIILAQ